MASDLTLSDQGRLVRRREFRKSPSPMRILVLDILAGLSKCFSETLWNKDWIIAKASRPIDLSRYRPPYYSREDPGTKVSRPNRYRGLKICTPPLTLNETKDAFQTNSLVDVRGERSGKSSQGVDEESRIFYQQ